MPASQELIDYLAMRFEKQREVSYINTSSGNASPLYAHLCLQIAKDPSVLLLTADADRHTQIPHLLFGAVHYLLISGIQHPLLDYYPDLTASPLPIANIYPHFHDFCMERSEEIRELVNTQRVQTNEIGRCAPLLPAFGLVSQRAGGRPLALVEIGASAGWHLRLDYYHYDYGNAGRVGDSASPVQLTCAVHGEHMPPVPPQIASIAYRVGLDIHPIDVNDENATRWLCALIWPEHSDRIHLLDAALTVARQHPVQIIEGNAVHVLPELLPSLPQDAVVCLYHSYALNQAPRDTREQILDQIREASKQRDLYRLSQEWYNGQSQPHLHMFSYHEGQMHQELLAYCETHGRWVEWL